MCGKWIAFRYVLLSFTLCVFWYVFTDDRFSWTSYCILGTEISSRPCVSAGASAVERDKSLQFRLRSERKMALD
jgi:hypothetical protein